MNTNRARFGIICSCLFYEGEYNPCKRPFVRRWLFGFSLMPMEVHVFVKKNQLKSQVFFAIMISNNMNCTYHRLKQIFGGKALYNASINNILKIQKYV